MRTAIILEFDISPTNMARMSWVAVGNACRLSRAATLAEAESAAKGLPFLWRDLNEFSETPLILGAIVKDHMAEAQRNRKAV